MTNLKPVDVAIIGGGWTGLLTAKEITEKTSLSVAVFERGGPRKLADYAVTMDELDYNIRLRMMQNTAQETITHRHSLKDSAVPVRQHGSFHPGTGTGGAGEHWGGASFRFLPDVFTLRTHLLQKHGAAKLPRTSPIRNGRSPTTISNRATGEPSRLWASAGRPAICAAKKSMAA